MSGGAMQQPGHMGNQWRGNMGGEGMKMGNSPAYQASFGGPQEMGGGMGGMGGAMTGERMFAGGSPNQGMAGGGMGGDAPLRGGGYQPPPFAEQRMSAGGGGQGYSLSGGEFQPKQRPYQWEPIQANPNPSWYPSESTWGGAGPAQPPATSAGQMPVGGQAPMGGALQNFQNLYNTDRQAAHEALNFNPSWMMQNMPAIQNMMGGAQGFQDFRTQNSQMSSNSGPISDAQRAMIRQRMGW